MVEVKAYDYGDLPDAEDADASGVTAEGNYETIYTRDGLRGPRHLIVEGLSIGTLVDAEGNGQPQLNAVGDDIADIDDEDGIIPPDTIYRGVPAVFQVFVTNTTSETAYLQGFVDWDDNGSLEEPNNKATPLSINSMASGWYDVTFMVPQEPNPLPERVAARFRLTTTSNTLVLSSTGPSDANDIDGEVEDLWVPIVGYDWGDLPEPLYATDASGGLVGPSHRVVAVSVGGGSSAASMYIGATPPDVERTGIPSAMADGDDNDNMSDEDLSPANFTNTLTNNQLYSGDTITLTVPVTNNTSDPASLMVFIDWNEDGVFDQATERYESTVDPADTEEIFNITIPSTTPTGTKGVRVRITSGDVFDAYGPAPNGEVEDFLVTVTAYDYGDLPDAEDADAAGITGQGNYETKYTIDGMRGPRHLLRAGLSIGTLIDSEGNGQPQLNAAGDDVNGIADEDGIIPPDTIYRDVPAVFQVFVSNTTGETAYLQGFIDWNDDGDFEDGWPNQKAPLVTIAAGESGMYDV
ncbi:MAG: GEVED domain-containing protein, partial [Saccharospirillaceae bacterium]|nr:GEVED domain-containing protein [Saccharospirillaceae bacterium]